MKLKQFIRTYRKLSSSLDSKSLICFVDEDSKPLSVKEYSIVEGKIILELSRIASYTLADLVLEFKDMNPETSIIAHYSKTNKRYTLSSQWVLDEEDNVCVKVHRIEERELSLEDTKAYIKDFSEEDKKESVFTGKITKIAKKMGTQLVYLAYWLYYALTSGKISVGSIALITGALGYLLCPVDIISDFLPFIGFSDDASILIAAYYAIIKSLTPENIKEISDKAKNAVSDIFDDFSDDDINL